MKTREEILDLCAESMFSGATVEEVLESYPEWRDELKPLLELGAELSQLPEPNLNLTRMMQSMGEAMEQEPPKVGKPKIMLFSRPVLLRVAASVTAVLMLGWGVMTASAATVPGDWFYPIKLLTERVRFALAINSEDKAELRIVFSERRLKEVVKKYEQGDGLDKALLAEMLDEASRALESVPELPEDSRDYVAARVLSVSRFQDENLKRIHAKASAAEQQTLKPYMDRCAQRCGWMEDRMDSPETWSGCDNGNDSCPW
jgi:hypothetical protein